MDNSVESLIVRRFVDIKFISNPKNSVAREEYKKIWQDLGLKIIGALEKYSDLLFLEKSMKAIVGKFKQSFSGRTLNEPMNLRASSHNKTATLMHELTHRLLMQYPGLWPSIKIQFNLEDVHQVVNLIFYPTMVEVIGQEEADRRVESECRSKDPRYKECWDWYRDPKNEEVRKKILEFIRQWKEQNTEERIK